MEPELKPCPCGEKAEFRPAPEWDPGYWMIFCDNPKCVWGFAEARKSKVALAAIWNRRAPSGDPTTGPGVDAYAQGVDPAEAVFFADIVKAIRSRSGGAIWLGGIKDACLMALPYLEARALRPAHGGGANLDEAIRKVEEWRDGAEASLETARASGLQASEDIARERLGTLAACLSLLRDAQGTTPRVAPSERSEGVPASDRGGYPFPPSLTKEQLGTITSEVERLEHIVKTKARGGHGIWWPVGEMQDRLENIRNIVKAPSPHTPKE